MFGRAPVAPSVIIGLGLTLGIVNYVYSKLKGPAKQTRGEDADWRAEKHQILLSLLYTSTESNTTNGYIHRGVNCNMCGVGPIKGTRYRCSECVDYDLCQDCAANANGSHDEAHLLMKINCPIPVKRNPTWLIPSWRPAGSEKTGKERVISDALLFQYASAYDLNIGEVKEAWERFKPFATNMNHWENSPNCFGISRQTIHDYISGGSLVGYTYSGENDATNVGEHDDINPYKLLTDAIYGAIRYESDNPCLSGISYGDLCRYVSNLKKRSPDLLSASRVKLLLLLFAYTENPSHSSSDASVSFSLQAISNFLLAYFRYDRDIAMSSTIDLLPPLTDKLLSSRRPVIYNGTYLMMENEQPWVGTSRLPASITLSTSPTARYARLLSTSRHEMGKKLSHDIENLTKESIDELAERIFEALSEDASQDSHVFIDNLESISKSTVKLLTPLTGLLDEFRI